jgi:hypothetical protein
MSGSFTVESGELRSAASGLSHIGGQVQAAFAPLVCPTTASLGSGNAAMALGDALRAWAKSVQSIADSADATSRAFVTAAGNYDRSDHPGRGRG